MTRSFARRAANPVLVIVSFVTFWLSTKLPGDPAVTLLGRHRPATADEHMRHQLGLDQPLP